MIPYERKEKIIEILTDEKLIKIEDLQKKIPSVSISTLRRDLKELEKAHRVTMLTGGAVKLSSLTSELPISTKESLYAKEKEKIAELAAKEIKDGDLIYLDSGSTCTALLNQILHKKITIVTTNASVFGITNEITAEITVLGGRFDPRISSMSGPLTEINLQQFNFEKAFLGANGVDVERGVSTPNLAEANKKRNILNHSKNAFLLCDSSKFHEISNVKAFDLEEVTVISDRFDETIANATELICS